MVVIILTTISGYLLSAYGLDKHYITTAEVYIESLDSQSAAEKATTCGLLFTSPQMYDAINETIENPFSYAEFDRMIDVEQVSGTAMLRITTDCDNSYASFKLMNRLIELMPAVIENYKEKANFQLVRSPAEPSAPSFPNDKIFTLGGMIIGFVIAIIGTIIIWRLDNTITADDDITDVYGVPVLGELPDFDNEIDYLGR